MEATRATYDLIATSFADRNQGSWRGLQEWIDRFTAQAPPEGVLLDVGCGPGRDARLMAGAGRTVVGLDLSEAMLRLAQPTPVIKADMRHLPVGDGAAAGVWSQNALLHVPRQDAPAALAEMHRVLSPGGMLCLCTAEGSGEGWEDGQYGAGKPRYFVSHSRHDLLECMDAAGFDVVGTSTERTNRQLLRLLAKRC